MTKVRIDPMIDIELNEILKAQGINKSQLINELLWHSVSNSPKEYSNLKQIRDKLQEKRKAFANLAGDIQILERKEASLIHKIEKHKEAESMRLAEETKKKRTCDVCLNPKETLDRSYIPGNKICRDCISYKGNREALKKIIERNRKRAQEEAK